MCMCAARLVPPAAPRVRLPDAQRGKLQSHYHRKKTETRVREVTWPESSVDSTVL